jgi:hypothetical protein
MKRAWLLVSVILPLSAAPASSGRMPELNVKAICKARDADAKLLRSTTGQSVDECVHDEQNAKQQLNSLWPATAVSIRSQCVSEGHSLGTTSYLDLITCIQLKNDVKPDSRKAAKQ